jgi:nitrite reductase (NO-forming)
MGERSPDPRATIGPATMTHTPTSRWRTGPTTGGRGAADRVRISHRQTRPTLALALAFVGAAALAAVADSGRWLPLHLLLAGGVVLAISGVSLMLTVTWSAAPAPPGRWVATQRLCIAAGAAGVAAGREAELPDGVVAVAGALYLAGLVGLGVLLVVTVRRGVERRFDVAVAAYLAALLAGTVAVALGVTMAVGTPSVELRSAHVTLNLLGLVGLVVGGTMPFFAATVGRSRMAPHAGARRLAVSLCWQVVALAVAAGGLAAGADPVAAVGLGAYAAGIGGVLWLLPRPTRRQLRWAGPRLVGLWAGAGWWAIAVAATAVEVARDEPVLAGRWLLVLVIAGYAQVVWGSLAYLLPMLRGGGHERLGEGFAATRSWVGLAAANTAGMALALVLRPVVGVAVAVWVLDSAWRAARVAARGGVRPARRA